MKYCSASTGTSEKSGSLQSVIHRAVPVRMREVRAFDDEESEGNERTSKTGDAPPRTTLSATLPRVKRTRPVRPCVVITIRATCTRLRYSAALRRFPHALNGFVPASLAPVPPSLPAQAPACLAIAIGCSWS